MNVMDFVAATRRPGTAKRVNVFGIEVDLLLTAEDTGGVYSVYEVTCPPGLGSPPHVHLKDDESFYVIEGMFEFRRGDEILTAGPGTLLALPRQVPHYFRCIGTEPGRLLGIGTPAGHERFFVEASALSVPPDPEEAMAVLRRHGMELVP
jgi:mannose-6-phosphate isomerase-like protein (cupin superfamily)